MSEVKPKVLILRVAGTNCDLETEEGFRLSGGKPERVHINRLLSGEKRISDYDILVIPGGFSYGDDIAAGKILANELRYKLKEEIDSFSEKGHPIIGICNGFQVLVKNGLLPGFDSRQTVALSFNDSGKFEDRWVYLKIEDSISPFLKDIPPLLYLPVAHSEGKFIPRDKKVLNRLKKNRQILFRYVDKEGNAGDYPINPNGSVESIAGICNKKGNVLGMMPHPERFLSFLHHPRWTREKRLGGVGDGLLLFKNIIKYCK